MNIANRSSSSTRDGFSSQRTARTFVLPTVYSCFCLVAVAPTTVCGADPVRDIAVDKEFVQRAIQAGFRDVPLSVIIQKRHLIPVLSDAARGETNRERLEGVVNVLSRIVLADDVEAARIARSEWLELARGHGAAALVARKKLEEVDADVKTWLMRVGVREQDVRAHYPEMWMVLMPGQELDPADLVRLRLLGPRRRADPAAQELGGSIRMLSLHTTKLEDQHLRYLSGLRNIEFVDLSATHVTGEGFRGLELPILRGVRLDDCPVTDATVQRIDVPSLEALYLGNTGITGVGLGTMSTAKIHQLYLPGTRVSASDLSKLKRFEGLLAVDLDGLIIDREAMGHLAACKGLRWVRLRTDLPKGITLEEVTRSLPNCSVRIMNEEVDEHSKPATGKK